MRILAPGNKSVAGLKSLWRNEVATSLGFTLLELMVVIAIIAVASAGVLVAIPDASDTALERDAQRLSALLDSARAQSRASGLAVTWHGTDGGFKFEGLPQTKNAKTGVIEDINPFPTQWLDTATGVETNQTVLLGPEPIIAKQKITLQNNGRSLVIVTDGMRPFAIEDPEKSNH